MRQSHRLIYNAVVILGTRALRFLPELVLLPFVIHRLGDEAYGLYVLAWSLIVALNRVGDPIQSAIVKYNASYMIKERIEEINSLISTAFVFSAIIAVIACITVIALALFCPHYLGISDPKLIRLYIIVFIIIGITILISFPMMPYVGAMYSIQRHDLFFISDTIASYIKAIVIVFWFMAVEPSITVLIVICGVTFIIPRAIMMIMAYRYFPRMKNRMKFCSWAAFQTIFSFAGILLLASICFVINSTGIKWIMGLLVSAAFVAHLEIILIPSRYLGQIAHAMTLTVMPAASKYDAMGNTEQLKELFVRGTRYISIILIPIIIGAIFTMGPVIQLWLGSEYKFLTKYILILLCSSAAQNTAYCANQMLRGVGKINIVLLNSIVGQAILPAAITIAVFKFTGDPYWAITIGLSAGVIIYSIMQIGFCVNIIKMSYMDILIKSYIQPLAIAIPLFTMALLVVLHWHLTGLPALIIVSFATVALYFLLFYKNFATQKERELLIKAKYYCLSSKQ